jgi:hypothetical protein
MSEEERLGLLHIKQCVSKHRKEVHNGANPLHSPSLKNKKGHLQLRPVGALPDISPTKASGKAERMCKWPQSLPPTATVGL